jgi:signal peptidase I
MHSVGRSSGRKRNRDKPKKTQSNQAQTPPEAQAASGTPAGEDAKAARKEETFREWALGWGKSIAIALAIWFVLQAVLVKSFRIDSGSMEPTLLEQDWLFISKVGVGAKIPLLPLRTPSFSDPRVGELVVFRGIEDPVLTIVKRVIGVAGDTLELRRDSLFRNSAHVPEPFAQHINPTARMDETQRHAAREWQLPRLVDGVTREDYLPDLRNFGPIVVPDGHLFLMGDNRDASHDGRAWGFLPRENVLGKPLFIYYSFEPRSRWLPALTAIRWGRIFSSPW